MVSLLFGSLQKVVAQEPFLDLVKKKENWDLYPLPIIYYTPETRLGFGLTLQNLFRFKGDTVSNVSNIGITALYTINRQAIFNPNWDIFINENQYRVFGAFVFQKYPQFFYGIGNNTNRDDKERFDAKFVLFKTRVTREVIKSLHLGVQYRLEHMYAVDEQTGGILDTQQIAGQDGYTASGIGLAALYDTRDHNIFPFKGTYIIFSNHFYASAIGSDNFFSNYKLDVRQYFNPGSSHVIALNALFNFNTDDPPFNMLAQMGGEQIMRGHFFGRYRERHLLAGQVEYRFPIVWRFIGVAFAGVGEVAHELNDLTLKDLRYSFGGGLRFTISAKERMNIRIDYGFGLHGERGLYIGFFESF